MDIRYYNTRDINLERLAGDLERVFVAQGFETQHFGSADHMTVQLRKGGDVAAIFGLRSAVTVVMHATPKGCRLPSASSAGPIKQQSAQLASSFRCSGR